MIKLFTKENILFFIFFISLILFKNDLNSKVIIGLVAISLYYFNYSIFKTVVVKNLPILALFAIIVISLLYTIDLKIGLKRVERLTIIPSYLLIFTYLSRQKIKRTHVYFIYILIISIATFYSHFKVISLFIENKETDLKHFFNLNYSYKALGNTIELHTTYYSMYILLAIVFLLNFIKSKKHNLYAIVLSVCLVIYFSLFIFQLSSRISIGILYIIILLNIIHFIISKKQLLKGGIVLVLFHVIGFFILMNVGVTKYRFQHLLGFTYYTGYTVNDTNHKTKLWTAAINANNNILVGNGIGDIQQSLNTEYEKYDLEKPLKNNYNSHNQYIEFYVGLGLIGLGLFIYLLLNYFWIFIKFKDFIGIQFIIIISITSFTECIWNRHHGIVFIVFWLFYLNNNYNKEKIAI